MLLLAIELYEGWAHAFKLLIVSVSTSISISRNVRRQGARWVLRQNSDDFSSQCLGAQGAAHGIQIERSFLPVPSFTKDS